MNLFYDGMKSFEDWKDFRGMYTLNPRRPYERAVQGLAEVMDRSFIPCDNDVALTLLVGEADVSNPSILSSKYRDLREVAYGSLPEFKVAHLRPDTRIDVPAGNVSQDCYIFDISRID
jgi:hypothetical protein